MDPREFRRHGHEVVDWIAEYLLHPERYPVLARVKPGALTDALPAAAPEGGEPMETILQDFESQVVPALTLWNHPGFMAYFAITGSPPGILGEMLAAAMNVNGMVWKSSPAATELEQVTLDWLRQWLGLPPQFGIIHDTASVSTLHAILAARHAAAPETRTDGAPPGLVLYTSEHAHSSVEKGALALGIGQKNVRKIGLDAQFRMRAELLEEAIERDRAAGLRPFCVVPTVGTTSTTAIDPVPAVAGIARRHGLWLHVDAAYGGSAAVAPEFRHVLDGCEHADSIVVNPHKWLGTQTDLSAFYTRRPEILREALALVPEYLRTADDPRALNYMDYGIALGRRFRALKLWFVMRHYGHVGLAAKIRGHIAMAQELARTIEGDPAFELAAPVPFSLVCFRKKATDQENQRLMDDVNATGEVFVSHTKLNGKFVMRLAIGNFATTREHIQRAWEIVKTAARSGEIAAH